MSHHQVRITVPTVGRGMIDITGAVGEAVKRANVGLGLCTVFIRHTSASLIVQENADPDVQRDLEAYMTRLVKDGDPLYRHTAEGPDDMSAHIRGVLTATSLQVPVADGRLLLGTWQAIYVWEHRTAPHRREVVVHVSGE
jgi:secondary thiamine-phosphate synthase enzyme